MATFNFQPFVQQYVPAPVQEFAALGEALNQRYEKNVAEMEELDFLSSQIQTLPTSSHIKEAMLRDVKNTLRSVREKGDLENAAPRIREAVRRFRTDPNLRQAAENFQKAKEYDDQINQMKLQGKTPLIFQDYKSEKFDDKGNLLAISADNQMQLDYRKRQETFFDNIQPDSNSISSAGFRQTADGYWVSGKSSSETAGITAEKIKEVANNSFGAYLQTEEGQQQLKSLTHSNYGNMSREDALAVMRNDFLGAGLERVFQRTSRESSSSPIADPILARQKQLADLAKTTMTGKKKEGTQGSYVIKASELSDATVGSQVPKSEWFTNKGFRSLVNYAFTGNEESRVKGKYELQNTLDNLASSDNPKVREAASQYQELIQRANKLIGEGADDYIAAALGTTKSLILSIPENIRAAVAEGRSNASPEELQKLFRDFRDIKSRNIGTIIDSSFEDAVEKSLNSPVTRNIPWMSPKYIGNDAFTANQSAAWERATSNKEWDINNFKIIRGNQEEAKELKDTRVSIEAVSGGSVGNGYGIGYLIRDSQGSQYVAVPKDTGFEKHLESQFLPTAAYALGADDLVYKNKFKYTVNPGQSKSLSEIANQNNLSALENLEGIRVIGTDRGFKLSSKGKNLKFGELYKDFQSSGMSPEDTRRLVDQAINSGVIDNEDIKASMDSQGDIDIRKLLNKIEKSDKDVIFESQYDIYRGYFK